MNECEIIIQYATDRMSESHRLVGRVFAVGSKFKEPDLEKGEIPLAGLNVADIQFFLIPDDLNNKWYIDAIGTTATFLGEQRLDTADADERFELKSNQAIRVPGAVITVYLRGAQVARRNRTDLDSWIRLQDLIHDEVFKARQLEPTDHKIDQDSPEIRSSVLKTLTDKTREALTNAPEETVKAAVSSAMRLAVLRSIASSSTDNWIETRSDGPARPGQLKTRAAEIIRNLGIQLEKNTVETDTALLNEHFDERFERGFDLMPIGDRRAIAGWFMASNVWNAMYYFGPITDLMELPMVTEVMVVRHDTIYIERFDKLEQYDFSFASPEKLFVILKRIVNQANREIDRNNAMVDFKLPDGSRVNAIIEPLSRHGPCVTIRKHKREILLTLDVLSERYRSLNAGMARFLQAAVLARKNIIVSGGTGSGKTTLLNALSAYIPEGQRVITIEDTAELALANSHVVSLESKPANAEGEGDVDIRKLVKNALRMRPDRIVVGECRSGEAYDMLQALNTGHAGSMTTAHSNGPKEMLMRLEGMVLQGEPNLPVPAIRQQMASAVDLIVQLNKVPLPKDPGRGIKLITEIAEVIDIHPMTGEILVESIYKFRGFNADGEPVHRFTGYLPTFVEEIDDAHHRLPANHSSSPALSLADLFAIEVAA